jgi:hypothetical protein
LPFWRGWIGQILPDLRALGAFWGWFIGEYLVNSLAYGGNFTKFLGAISGSKHDLSGQAQRLVAGIAPLSKL